MEGGKEQREGRAKQLVVLLSGSQVKIQSDTPRSSAATLS